MKVILNLVCLGLFALFQAGAENKAMAAEASITILFTGDRHGHIESWIGWEGTTAGKRVGGMDRLATAVKSVRREAGAQNVLLLDSGDAIGDTLIAAETKGKAVVEMMNLVGYDAMTIGNHEPDFTPEELRARMSEARFPFLAVNLFDKHGKLFAEEFLVREVGAVKVGILGLAYPNTPLTTAGKNVEGLQFKGQVETARSAVPRMKAAGADIVVALVHGGLGAEKKLAEAVPGIDVIVGGHSHNRTEQNVEVGRTIVVQAGAHGQDLGRLDLSLSDGRIVRHRVNLIVLDHEHVDSDPEAAERLREIVAPFADKQNEVFGTAISPIIRAQTMAGNEPRHRNQESPADSLFADILRVETGSDIALLPGVGYGVAIPKGPITAGLLRNLIPHDSKVVTLTLTGAQIRQIIEQAIHNTFTENPSEKVGGMINVSGLEFTYNESAASGQRVTKLQAAGRDIAPSGKFKVATNSMLAEGGHNYKTFLDATDKQEHEGQFETVSRWIRKQGQVRPPTPGRIQQSNTR
jgi:5'-nucleotidase / UDP-sugar diphosphatase